jgi:DNA-directed RNA polymerase specialized sigma24 family protein
MTPEEIAKTMGIEAETVARITNEAGSRLRKRGGLG